MKTNCLQEVGTALRRGARLTSAFLLFAWSGLALAVSSFPDVASTSWASLYIEAIYGAGITTGCGGGNYCPANPVTRDQMAAFLIRAKAGEPPANYCQSASTFSDVASAAWSCGYVKWLAEMAITTGCGSGKYCPAQNVTREQMAAFLVRAMEGEPPSGYCASGSGFADVLVSNGFCKYIKRLAELGVTTGCGGGNYCPSQTVTRDQMAAFLARAFLGVSASNAWAKKLTLVEVSATGTQTITASWLPVDDGVTPQGSITYQLHLSTQADFLPDVTTLAASGAGILSAQVSGLAPGTTYFARVRAIGPSAQQTTSDTSQIKTPTLAPIVNPGVSTRVLGAGDATQSGANTFLLAPGAAAPAIGSLLANSQGDGYLKKVVSVVDIGGQWQVTTVPAGLHEAYQQLELSGSVKIAPLPGTGALAPNTRSNTSGVGQTADGNASMTWPQSGFSLSGAASQAPSLATGGPLGADLSGKLRATRAGAPLFAETTVRNSVSGKWVQVVGPQAVSIVPGNTGATKISLNVFHDDQTSIFTGSQPIPIAICKIDNVTVDAPSGKDASGLVSLGSLEATVQESDPLYGGGNYTATRAAKLPVQITASAAQVAAEAYTLRFKAYVDEAGNGCVDATRSMFLGWKETIDFSLPIYVVSEPNFPDKEETTLSFEGGVKVVNDVKFTFTPELDTEVNIQGFSVKKASLIAKADALLEQQLTVTATGAASLDITKNLIPERKFVKVFMAGSVPVVMTGSFSADMRVQGTATGVINATESLTMGFDNLEYGFEYANGTWNTVQNVKPTYTLKLSGDADAEATITVSLLPKMNVTFYEALTGRLVVEPYLTAEAGLHGHVRADFVPEGVTTDADYWITKGKLSGGLNAWISANVEGCELSFCKWPSTADEADYQTYQKLELIASTPIMGIPTLTVAPDNTVRHPTNSRAILFRGSHTEVANPFHGLFGGPEAFIGFGQWTKPKVIALNDTGYQILDPINGAADQVWIAFDKPGTYTIRLGGYSSLGGWARQVVEGTITVGDADNDGMLDWWEQYYGITDPNGDADGDGVTNLAEFNAGTNPNSADQYSLAVTYQGAAGGGSVGATGATLACNASGCTGNVPAGQGITLTAQPNAGYTVGSWGGDCTGTVGNSCVLLMNAAKNVTVSFQPAGYLLTVSYLGAPGGGTVSGLPAYFACSISGCTGNFAVGQTTGLVAQPNPGYVFAGWGGYCTGVPGDSCPVGWLTGPTTVTITFQHEGGAATGKLNDTGIQFCGAYPSGNNSPCLGTEPAGQDAQYGRDAQAAAGTLTKIGGGEAGFDFTALDASGNPTTPSSGANSHPCVKDNVTGLIWEVKTADYGPRSGYWTYTWFNSTSPDGNPGKSSGGNCYQAGRCDTEKYLADVNAVGLCGFHDWRMPTVKELEGIADLGRTSPTIDPTYFPNTVSSYFWSGSPSPIPPASASANAWQVHFGGGYAGYYGRADGGDAIRLVRDGR